MSDQDIISPYNIKQTSDENKEKIISVRGLVVDPIPNSQKQHQKSCIADGTRNY